MTTMPPPLSPLQAYLLAERQKRRIGDRFRAKIIRLHRSLSTRRDTPAPPSGVPASVRPHWRDACSSFAQIPATDPATIAAAYRDVVMRYGLKRVDPATRRFGHDLREFHRNYAVSFPLPEEQESRQGFRDLWRAGAREGGYQELGYSIICPLTGRYVMGLNFTVQPRSDSVHFIYGFISPFARGIGGFSNCLIQLMQQVALRVITAHFERCPEDRPPYHDPTGPLVLFEKNIIDRMSLTDILMDTAHIDIDRPPRPRRLLAASAISQSLRDMIWDRRGGRIIDYNYMQSSLDGVVRVPDGASDDVIALLNGKPLDDPARPLAAQALAAALAGRVAGCTALNLCAFVPPGKGDLPAEQIRRSNQIFQGISVVKDVAGVIDDIYFRAQMISLSEHAKTDRVALRPILPAGPGARDFEDAETITKRLLRQLTWRELQASRDKSYGDWLRERNLAAAEDRS